ncbi:transposase [Bacillus cereus]|uniref:transposase n=1 Tax=Bacillus cereus TaxID=1396 RepID=UPI00211234E1|nr:transposase [Bacillus cereus]MCQ6307408.1 transposase [Bacillus cereus]MCQ6318683.1 transposase [Bacillus cereus]
MFTTPYIASFPRKYFVLKNLYFLILVQNRCSTLYFHSALNRLLTNCIIYYNASILSNILTKSQNKGIGTNILKYISPVAWQHINFYGRYEFNNSPTVINLETILGSINEEEMLNQLIPEKIIEE